MLSTTYQVPEIFDCHINKYQILKLSNEVTFDVSNFLKYDRYVLKSSQIHSIDPDLIRSIIIVESKYNPAVGSHRGASGLMQLMPLTAKYLNVTDRKDPEQSIEGGTKYLRELFTRFGNLDLTLAAYNAGPTIVGKYNKIPPIKETGIYVRKVKYLYKQLSKNN